MACCRCTNAAHILALDAVWVAVPLQGGEPPVGPKWTRRDLNPGPSACEADVIPLHHEPYAILYVGGGIFDA